MLKDLEEPVFAQLFTAEWENNYGESLSSVIVATLQDYFQDVKVWLPDYFYCKFVKEVLFTLTGLYVMQVSTLDLGSAQIHLARSFTLKPSFFCSSPSSPPCCDIIYHSYDDSAPPVGLVIMTVPSRLREK